MYSSSNVVNLFSSPDGNPNVQTPDLSVVAKHAESGFIKLFRSLQDCSFADQPKMFSTWVHLLLRCTHKTITRTLGRFSVVLEPGQFIAGRKVLAQCVGTTEKEMRTILSFFEREGMIRRDAKRTGSVFTVLNYGAYQGTERPENGGQQGANEKGQPESEGNGLNNKGFSGSDHSAGANTGPADGATKQENKNINIDSSIEESCEKSFSEPIAEKSVIRPDAAIQTPNGKKWALQDDLSNARQMADTVARLQGIEKSARTDQELVNWANDCRLLRGMKTNSGKTIQAVHIRKLWEFAHQDSFWSQVVLSPKALRKNWETLAIRYQQQRNSASAAKPARPQNHNGRSTYITSFREMDYTGSEIIPEWARED